MIDEESLVNTAHEPIRFGLVGLGLGKLSCRRMQQRMKLCWGGSRKIAGILRFCSKPIPGCICYGRLPGVSKAEDVDVVDVVVPSFLHRGCDCRLGS